MHRTWEFAECLLNGCRHHTFNLSTLSSLLCCCLLLVFSDSGIIPTWVLISTALYIQAISQWCQFFLRFFSTYPSYPHWQLQINLVAGQAQPPPMEVGECFHFLLKKKKTKKKTYLYWGITDEQRGDSFRWTMKGPSQIYMCPFSPKLP